MSGKRSSSVAITTQLRRHVPIFAALGDETRLALLARLCQHAPCSIAELTEGAAMTRQGVTKHLRILEEAGLVRGEAQGRERLFQVDPKALLGAKDYLECVSARWDETLSRLKAFVEEAG